MSKKNIDFGSFPDDPSADAIRTAFQKTQDNFDQLFQRVEGGSVLSINKTPGAGIIVNSPTGDVVVTAQFSQLQVHTSTLSLGVGSNGSYDAVIGSASQTLYIDLPNSISNVVNMNLSGNVSAAGNITATNIITGNSIVTGANAIVANTFSASGNITGANLITGNYIIRSVETNISAAGTDQASATSITKEINVVSSVSAGQGVILPNIVPGMAITITNTNANSLLVYPSLGAQINSLGTNIGFTQNTATTLQFIAPTTTQWYIVGSI